MSVHRLVVVGNGMAGSRLVENVLERAGQHRFEIVVFGEEPQGAYNRILLSGVLAGTHRHDDIVTHPASWYARHGVDLRAGVRVDRIDLAAGQIVAADGTRTSYGTLVFATGSIPHVPTIAGLATPAGELRAGAFVFRSLADCDRMIDACRTARTAVVVGGGLLGLEAARGLANRGLDVSVIHLTPHVMDAQLDRDGSRVLHRQVEASGIRVLAGRTTAAVLGTDRVEGVALSDGATICCDMIVVAAGVRPRISLAAEAGLAVRRGILVDDDLRCAGTDRLFAVGECAEHRGHVHGLVAPAWEQADVLADRLTGRRPGARYEGSRLATKLKIAGLDVAVMGKKDADAASDIVSYSEESRGIYKKLIVHDNRLVGAILIGAGPVVPTITRAFLEAVPLPQARSELLFPPAFDRAPASVGQMPDGARVCDCNAVTKAQIVEAVLTGATSLREVCGRTRAGTGCGSCRPEVQRIVDFVCQSLDEAQVSLSRPGEDSRDAGYAAS
jgi:nitrite reductase (NADH) large subunit